MRQTVIGIFNNESEAEAAVSYLLKQGFNENNIDVCNTGIDDYSSSESGKVYRDDGDSIGAFFRYLFGTGSEARDFSDVARNGSVVTVHANSPDEALTAAELLDLYGAVDVNEKVSYLRKVDKEGEDEYNSPDVISNANSNSGPGNIGNRSRIIEKPVEENLRLKANMLRTDKSR